MACGLPGIVSDTCGATQDMIIEGETGYSYPMGDVQQLAILMMLMADSLDNCRQMGLRAAGHVQNFSVPLVVSALKNILQDISKK
jgi:glycosyltransferase involved in cell wall biosynthesis